MTSVQRFLRQRSVGNTTLSVPSTPGTSLYVFLATGGNYVGNYPPGVMVTATAAGAALPTSFPTGTVLRDMGKTIQASVSAGVSPYSDAGTPGFFREVQIVSPVTVATATSSTTFGDGIGSLTPSSGPVGAGNAPASYPTGAGNAGDDGYGTFYLPIVVGGVVASGPSGVGTATLSATSLLLGNSL